MPCQCVKGVSSLLIRSDPAILYVFHVLHSVSNGLVMARLAVACTDEALYVKALEAFWYIHTCITDAVEKHKSHPGRRTLCVFS